MEKKAQGMVETLIEKVNTQPGVELEFGINKILKIQMIREQIC